MQPLQSAVDLYICLSDLLLSSAWIYFEKVVSPKF